MHRVVEARFKTPVADPRNPTREMNVAVEGDELRMWKDGGSLWMQVPGDDETTWEVDMGNVRCCRIHRTEVPQPSSSMWRTSKVADEQPPPTQPSSPRIPVKRTRTKRGEAA